MSVKAAEKRAWQLICENDIDRPAVDVESLAHGLGIDIQYEPFDGELSGVLIRNQEQNTFVIGVNEIHPKVRQRFTIAHEIGHFLLHKGNELFVDESIRLNYRRNNETYSSTAAINEEMQANAFAAALLMPEQFICDYIEKHNGYLDYNDSTEIEAMAAAFQVSTQALLIRLGKLKMFS